MATTVGQHSVAAFTSPVNGTTPIDANTVRGNDNTVRVAYVDHDADPGIHVQSSTLASRPTAGTAGRKWITEDSGVYTLWFDDGTNWHPVSSENIALSVLATEALNKGDVVKIVGWNNGQDLPEVAKTAASSDVAFAIIAANVSINTMGYAINTGIIQDVNTNAFNVGDVLYANGSGGLTATKPTSGNYQACAYVLRKSSTQGVLYVEFSAPRIVERSTNTASTIVLRDASGDFAAGTITATAVNTTTIDLTNLEVTNIKAKDGTASATIADSTGVMTIGSSVLTTTDINGGTIDGTTIGGSSPAVGTFTTLNATTVNTTTLDLTNLEVTNIKAKDGTAAATIADSTGKITVSTELAVDNLNLSGNAITSTDTNGNIDLTPNGTGEVNITKVDIDSGTIDGTTIGGSIAAAGTFTTVAATTGNITTVNATTVDATNVEVTNVKAKDGTASIAIADSTGVATISAAPILSALTASQAVFTNSSKALVSNAITGTGNVVMSASPTLTGTVTADTVNATTLGGTLSTAAQTNITSVGTLTSLTVSGDLTVDTNTLKVDATNNWVGMGTTSVTADTRLEVIGKRLLVGVAASNTALELKETTNSRSVYFNLSNGALNVYNYASTNVLNLDANGSLAVDGTTFNVDATNNRVGIGTATPVAPLEVVGTAKVNGTMYVQGPTNTATIQLYGASSATDGAFTIKSEATRKLTFNDDYAGATRLTIDSAGNLGLGVTPNTWTSFTRVIEVGNSANALASGGTNDTTITANVYFNSGFKYGANGYANLFSVGYGDGTFRWFSAANNTSGAGASVTFGNAKMTLDASGNLGVGTTTTGYARVTSAGTIRRTMTTSGTSASPSEEAGLVYDDASVSSNRTGIYFFNAYTSVGDSWMSFKTTASETATERARITSGGYFKASDAGTYQGSTASYHELRTSASTNEIAHCSHTASSGTFGVRVNYTAAAPNGTDNWFLYCNDNAAVRAVIRSNGGLANYQANNVDLSDARTKTDITPLDSMWGKVAALEIVSYKYVDQTHDDVNLGVIAQQVETVEPVWVDSDGFGDTPEGEEPMKTVYNKDITFAAIKALQEAMARIEALEARLEALEA